MVTWISGQFSKWAFSGGDPSGKGASPGQTSSTSLSRSGDASSVQSGSSARTVPHRGTLHGGKGSSGQVSTGKEIEVRDQAYFRATCASACLVALADGRVSDGELRSLIKGVRNAMEISGYADSEALAYFQICADALMTNPANRQALVKSVENIKGRWWQARKLMTMCLELCQADNEVTAAEEAELELICQTLALEPQHYGLKAAA